MTQWWEWIGLCCCGWFFFVAWLVAIVLREYVFIKWEGRAT